MGRKLNHTEKGISLTLFYLRYLLYLFLAIVIICVTLLLAFNEMAGHDMIYPANYAQEQVNRVQTKIEHAPTVSEDLIPELCHYVLFDLDGNILSGNMERNAAKNAWKAVNGTDSYISSNVYKVIQRDKEYCILQYTITPQYKSELLRKYLLPPQTLIILITLILIFLSITIVAIRFGRVLKMKMNALNKVAEKVQNQDLNFIVEPSNIREINDILMQMDRMRKALKDSLENQWKEDQSRKDQISALAHDLKTPLTIVRGNADILYDTNPTKEQIECIDYINESSLQMQDYVKMLIDITKSKNLYSPQIQDTLVSDFVHNIQKQAKGLCLANHISLRFECRSEIKHFKADSNLLTRALINILSNAVENCTSKGQVTVDVYDEESCLVFAILDTGKGFSTEELKYATTQFYRGDSSRNSKSHFGIGLYVADTVVQQHGGSLMLENLSDASGAKVTIRIPVS